MISTETKGLYQKLRIAHNSLRKVHTSDERLALINYIGNLYCSLICLGEGNVEFDKSKIGGKKNYQKFIKRLDIYTDRMVSNYILSKDFHKDFLGEIIPDIEEEMQIFCPLIFQEDDRFTQKEFIEIAYSFTRSLDLDGLFDKLYKKGNIYSTIIGQGKGNLGFTLYNPLNKDIDLFIRDFKYDLSTMNTLMHEFGHAYDLEKFPQDIDEYNRFFYLSFYGEVMSRLFERLLYHYLLDNGIKPNAVKDKMIDFEDVNHDYLLKAYILSLLDKEFLIKEGYIECDSEVIVRKVRKYFLEGADIKTYIEGMDNVDLAEIYNYAYGDIISMFLAEEVRKNGLDSGMIEYFFEKRSEIFHESFLRECGFGPQNYIKLYKKEVDRIRK